MKLKKGSIEAKRFMAKIRAMKSGTKKKSIGATKMVEKQYKETSKTKPKRVIQITRDEYGQFKKFKQLNGLGATKMVEKQYKETSKTKPKRVVQITRDKFGQFKKFNQISGLKKDVIAQFHNKYEKIDKYTEMKNYYNKMSKDRNINITDRKHYKYMYNTINKYLSSLKKEIIQLKKLI
jgi:hypothetical protein